MDINIHIIYITYIICILILIRLGTSLGGRGVTQSATCFRVLEIWLVNCYELPRRVRFWLQGQTGSNRPRGSLEATWVCFLEGALFFVEPSHHFGILGVHRRKQLHLRFLLGGSQISYPTSAPFRLWHMVISVSSGMFCHMDSVELVEPGQLVWPQKRREREVNLCPPWKRLFIRLGWLQT